MRKTFSFTRFSLALVLAALFIGGVSCAQQSPQSPAQTPAIQVSVDRVDVGVIVTDAQGQFVEGLQRQNFHLFDNGVEQPVSDFAAIETPGQVLLLVEAGPAVYLLEHNHLVAAHTLLSGLATDDRVAVARYNEGPEGILDYTADKGAVAGALEALRFNSGFGALNLSKSISQVLDWLANIKGKKTILLLSTGVDTSQLNDFQSALARLKTSDVRILAVSLTGGLRNPPPGKKKKAPAEKSILTAQQFAEADETLKELAEATGGRAYFPNSLNDFNAVYTQVAQLVRHEYSIAFAPPAHDGKLHTIDVRVSASSPSTPATGAPEPSYKVDHRTAYIAPAP